MTWPSSSVSGRRPSCSSGYSNDYFDQAKVTEHRLDLVYVPFGARPDQSMPKSPGPAGGFGHGHLMGSATRRDIHHGRPEAGLFIVGADHRRRLARQDERRVDIAAAQVSQRGVVAAVRAILGGRGADPPRLEV